MPKNSEKKDRSSRISKVEKEERIRKVVEALCQGTHPYHISRIAAEEWNWQLGKRQIRNYIRWARERLAEEARLEHHHLFGLAIARLTDLYKKAYGEQDWKTCLHIQKEINKWGHISIIKVT